MMFLFWFLLFAGGLIALAYHRTELRTATTFIGAGLAIYTLAGDGGFLWLLLLWLIFGGLLLLNNDEFRKMRITRPALDFYRKLLPSMSDTEREALEAGAVWWDGELFSGCPDWSILSAAQAPRLSAEEQAFLDGPCEELCKILNEWQITHELGDMPPDVWEYIKKNGFFAMIIPKKYGGLEFSDYAHSRVLIKIASHSTTAASTIAVPNALGPAELLLHYGTEEQKERYLYKLATGEEIPCFALTGPRAGSDAASIPDDGVICKGQWDGKEIIGIRLNWNKRYITLAPVATVLGLAFKLYDPDHLAGDKDEYGITAALIPTNIKGVTIGRRHFPLNIPFQNGPTQGKDVFIPLDYIIGGMEMAGQGWRMLVEQLTAGRSISLPSNTTGGAKRGVWATGAYARLRTQFNLPIGRFEGVEEALARIAGLTYIMDAATSVTCAAQDSGIVPAVPSAILKYHCTEMSRIIANDAMDIHGGKGICLGPENYLARGYQAVPIAITVEGANILTRSLIIFGQGAIRCHPYVLKEMQAAQNDDPIDAIEEFDEALCGHVGYAVSNAARSLVLALTHARYTDVPIEGGTRRYYQHINRYSAAFALATDWAMLTLGGELKIRELLSARLGDVLSSLYLASMVLKHHENQGRPPEDLPVVEWACRHLLYSAQERLHSFLLNFPNRWVARMLRILVFPRGRTYFEPSDKLGHKVVELIMQPSDTRERLCAGIFRNPDPKSSIGIMNDALKLAIELEPIEKKFRDAIKKEAIKAPHFADQINEAIEQKIINKTEAQKLRRLDKMISQIIAVDDFAPDELGTRSKQATQKKAVKKKAKKKKTASKTATKDVAKGPQDSQSP